MQRSTACCRYTLRKLACSKRWCLLVRALNWESGDLGSISALTLVKTYILSVPLFPHQSKGNDSYTALHRGEAEFSGVCKVLRDLPVDVASEKQSCIDVPGSLPPSSAVLGARLWPEASPGHEKFAPVISCW